MGIVTETLKRPFAYRPLIEFPQITPETLESFKKLEKGLKSKARTFGVHLSITERIISGLVKEEDQGWVSKEFYERDRSEYERHTNSLIVGTQLIENPKEATKTIRWILASSAFILADEARFYKKAVSEELKQTARREILDAIDLTEDIGRISLNRNWINLNILNPYELINPNRQNLLRNLTTFVNNPPVLAKNSARESAVPAPSL